VASLKEFNTKIQSLQNTTKVTNAMKMIATTKYKKLFTLHENTKPFMQGYYNILSRLLDNGDETASPFFKQKTDGSAHIILFTSDRGLCGAHNNTASKMAIKLAAELSAQNKTVSISFVGKRGRTKLSNADVLLEKTFEMSTKDMTIKQIQPLADHVIEGFISGRYNEVWLVYNKFQSALIQIPTKDQLLPLSINSILQEIETVVNTGVRNDYLFEPDRSSLFNSLLPEFLACKLYQTLLMSVVSEFSSRMTAMEAATNNCKTMIDNYMLLRNRARQSAITTELTEIVSGKEAL